MNIFQHKYTDPFTYYTFDNIFTDEQLTSLNNMFKKAFYTQHTEQDEIDENFDQKNISYYDVTDTQFVELFTSKRLINSIESELNVNLQLKGVKMTLMSIIGPRSVWVHPDSEEKIVSIVIYLGTNNYVDKGTWIYSDMNTLHSKLDHKPNTGLVFAPNTNTWHSCPELDANDPVRRSIMINYIDIPNRLQILRDPSLKIPQNVHKLI